MQPQGPRWRPGVCVILLTGGKYLLGTRVLGAGGRDQGAGDGGWGTGGKGQGTRERVKGTGAGWSRGRDSPKQPVKCTAHDGAADGEVGGQQD